MWKLAWNEKAVLIKTQNREYWYIEAGFAVHGCINSQEKDYNAKDALVFFEKRYGKATNKHGRFDSM